MNRAIAFFMLLRSLRERKGPHFEVTGNSMIDSMQHKKAIIEQL
jgi:hypothetical protein